MNTAFLVFLALAPALALCIYVFKKDRVEKEPVSLLLKLFLLGAVSCFPAACLEGIFSSILNLIYAEQAAAINNSVGSAFYEYKFFECFLVIALVEEAVKLFILVWITRKNKEFNSLFDGLIYSVFVSLGFAALENVLYVMEYGIGTALLRAVMSVPGHMFFAVMMGYHYSMWHITDKAAQTERRLKMKGIINPNAKEYSSVKSMIMCLVVPVLAHGLYDYCCMLGTGWSVILLLLFVVFMYVHCFKKIKKMSIADGLEDSYVRYLIQAKYPYIGSME